MRKTSVPATSCPSSTSGFVHFLFVIIELASWRIVHFGVTRSPTDEWVAQQRREATPFGQAPRFLIRDRDSKYGEAFTRAAIGTSIVAAKTPYRAPKANAICERFLGSVRREYLDHVLVMGEQHLDRVIRKYVEYFNRARPPQGMGQQIPDGAAALRVKAKKGKIITFPVLSGCMMTTSSQRETLSDGRGFQPRQACDTVAC